MFNKICGSMNGTEYDQRKEGGYSDGPGVADYFQQAQWDGLLSGDTGSRDPTPFLPPPLEHSLVDALQRQAVACQNVADLRRKRLHWHEGVF